MKRTKKPHRRQDIKKQDIELQLIEEPQSLGLVISIQNLRSYRFPEEALVILEIYDPVNLEQVELGSVASFGFNMKYVKTIDQLPDSFRHIDRRRIRFRLKVVGAEDASLLGLADKLQERNYTESIIETRYEAMDNIFKIDWSNYESPVLVLNSSIDESVRHKIQPLIAEIVYREILTRLLLDRELCDDSNRLEDHEWIRFSKTPPELLESAEDHWTNALDHIEKTIGEHSAKKRLIQELNQKLKA